MTTATKTEHLQWALKRALAYLDHGDVVQAFTSFASDLANHPETASATHGPKMGEAFLLLLLSRGDNSPRVVNAMRLALTRLVESLDDGDPHWAARELEDGVIFRRLMDLVAMTCSGEDQSRRGVFLMLLSEGPNGTVRTLPGYTGIEREAVLEALGHFLANPGPVENYTVSEAIEA